MLCFDGAKRHVKFFIPCCSFKKSKVTLESRLEKQFFMTSLFIWTLSSSSHDGLLSRKVLSSKLHYLRRFKEKARTTTSARRVWKNPSAYARKLQFFDTPFPLARTLFVNHFWMPFKSQTCHRQLVDILLCDEINQGTICKCYIYIYTYDMYGIRLPHIFGTPYISIYKSSISYKWLCISSRNLGCQSKYLVLLINNFEILGFSHIWFRAKYVFNPGLLIDYVHIL